MLKIACDYPDCETELEWSEPESIPDGWWLIEQKIEDTKLDAPQYVACSPACVRGIAETLIDEGGTVD